MANNGNLIVPTSEQARINGRKGGLASQEAYRRKKTLKEELEILLELVENGKTNQEHSSIALLNEVKKGNVKAFEVLRDTIGQKATEKVEISTISKETIDNVESYFND